MMVNEPVARVDNRFSQPGAEARSWAEVERTLDAAEMFWLTTVRADGRPHVTPLIGIWTDGAFFFTTGPGEQKAKILETNQAVAVTTGVNTMAHELDVIIEGQAERERDSATLEALTRAYSSKYRWKYEVRDEGFYDPSHSGWSQVFQVRPRKVLGFHRGKEFSQTRWQFTD